MMASILLVALADGVLWDARNPQAVPAGVETSVPAAEAKRVVAAIARRAVADRRECADGLVVYTVRAKATGAFTAKGATETAYVVEGQRCDEGAGGIFDATHLLVFRGETIVARAKGPSMLLQAESDADFHGTSIRAVADVDGDGVREILAGSSGFGQGIVEEMGRLYSVKDGRVRRLRSLESAYEDTCGSGLENKRVAARVYHYAADGAITFETWFAECHEGRDPRPGDFAKPE
jgi:hypothetical protein